MHYILKYYYKWLSINIIKYAHSQYVLCKCTIGRLYVCNNFRGFVRVGYSVIADGL